MYALKVSCNYYFTAIGDRLNIWDLHKWAVRFGLHGPTGLEILSLDGKTDFNVVANPDVVEGNRRRTAFSSVKRIMSTKYNIELTDEQAWDLIDIDRQYTKLVNYLRDNGLFKADDRKVHDAANDLLNIFYEGRWSDWEFLRVFIGQSATSVTPLAVARYIAAIANGNRVMETHVVKQVRSPEGQVIKETKPKYVKLDIKDRNIAAIKEGMRRVVNQRGGTGYNAFAGLDPSITLGGKTGTAQVKPGIVERNTAWFTAFTPYDDPEIAVAVVVPNGKTAGNTAHIARRIIEEYYKITRSEQGNALPDTNELVR